MSATNRGAKRASQDSYPTPGHAADALLPYLDLANVRSFLEPCIGTGVIWDRVPAPTKHWAEITRGRDYLQVAYPPVDLIWTNPPYSLALEFLAKSLQEAASVIYLLRVNFLGAKSRRAFWNANRPTHMFPITPRPIFIGKRSDATEYAWFCWDRGGLIQSKHWLTVLDAPRFPGRDSDAHQAMLRW